MVKKDLYTHNGTPAIMRREHLVCSYCLQEDNDCECNGNKGAVKTRTNFVMDLVYLYRHIENTEKKVDREVLKDDFFNVLEGAKLTDKERKLFEFEANNIGI